MDDIAGAAETSKGGIYFHFPTKEAIFRELMSTTADKLVAKVERAVALETEPVARAEAAIHTVLAVFSGHRTMARLLFLDTVGAGRVFQAEANALHERFARLIQGYLDEAVAAGACPPMDTRITSIAWFGAINEVVGQWLLAEQPGRLEDAYPALAGRAAPERGRVGRAHRRGPAPAGGMGLPGAHAMTAVHPPGPGARPQAPGDVAAGLGERLAGLLDAGAGDATLVSATVPAPSIDPISLVAAAIEADLEVALWLRPSEGTAFVGVGRAWATSPAGPDRFREAEVAWREAMDGARIDLGGADAPGAGPVLLGALGFTGRVPAADDPWGPFGACSLVLPELLLAVTPDGASLTGSLAGPVAPRRRRAGSSAAGSASRPEPARWRPTPTAWSRCRCSRRSPPSTSSPRRTTGVGWSACSRAPSGAGGSTRWCSRAA